MKEVKNLFSKYLAFVHSSTLHKQEILREVGLCVGVEVSEQDLVIRDHSVTVLNNQALKQLFFLKKKNLLEVLKKYKITRIG